MTKYIWNSSKIATSAMLKVSSTVQFGDTRLPLAATRSKCIMRSRYPMMATKILALNPMSKSARPPESRICLSASSPLLQFHVSAPTFQHCYQPSKPPLRTFAPWSVEPVKSSEPRLRGCAGLHRCPSNLHSLRIEPDLCEMGGTLGADGAWFPRSCFLYSGG